MRFSILAGMVLLGAGLIACSADEKTRSPGSGEKPGTMALKDDVRKLMETARTKFNVPALGVVITSSKEVLTLEVQGLRKMGATVKAQPADKFHLGSNTKQFTALLFSILVQQKKLSYDLTLAKAFPEYAKTMPASFRGVTLDLLLRHRAGMPGNLPDWWKVPMKGTTRQQRLTVLKWAVESKAVIRPDETFAYSNLGYVLATAMVEKTLNASYEALMKKYVFDPLGIKSAGFGPTTMNKLVIEQPWGHEEDGTPVEPSLNADNPPVQNPATRLHCSLGDWAKYAADQLKGDRGEKALMPAAAYKKLHDTPIKAEVYTLGAWIVLRTPKGNVLMHDGSNMRNYACVVLDPTRDYAILVACNMAGNKRGEAAAQARATR